MLSSSLPPPPPSSLPTHQPRPLSIPSTLIQPATPDSDEITTTGTRSIESTMGSPSSSSKGYHPTQHYYRRHTRSGSSSSTGSCSSAMGVGKGKGKASLITRFTPLIPFISISLSLLSLHLVSLLQTRLYLVSHRHPIAHAVVKASSAAATAAAGSASQSPENEWERYWILFEAVRMWLWFGVAGAAAGCYGVIKASPRALLVSILHSHFTLLLTLSSAVPLLVIAIFPSIFTVVEPLPPLICEEILSHPQALRDVFEPLLLLSPYEDAGCEGWISSFAAPITLLGVIGYGIVHWWMNRRVRGYYGLLCRKQSRCSSVCPELDEKKLELDEPLISTSPSVKTKPSLAVYLGRASIGDVLPPSPTIPSPHVLYLPIPATHPLHRSAFSPANLGNLVMIPHDVADRVVKR